MTIMFPNELLFMENCVKLIGKEDTPTDKAYKKGWLDCIKAIREGLDEKREKQQ